MEPEIGELINMNHTSALGMSCEEFLVIKARVVIEVESLCVTAAPGKSLGSTGQAQNASKRQKKSLFFFKKLAASVSDTEKIKAELNIPAL